MFQQPIFVFFRFRSHPAGTRWRNDVDLTMMRLDDIASTSVQRRFDVICLLGSVAVYVFAMSPPVHLQLINLIY